LEELAGFSLANALFAIGAGLLSIASPCVLPVLPIVCVVLGVLTARKTHRSLLNWVLVGVLAGVIPVMGPILMVVAYLWYPPPPPSSRRGYHPPGGTGGGSKQSARPRDRR